MFSKIKMASILVGVLLVGLIGWHGYNYFFVIQDPQICVVGIEEKGSYAGSVACIIDGNHPYSVCKISVWLDSHPLISSFKINKKEFEHSFDVNTRTIPQG